MPLSQVWSNTDLRRSSQRSGGSLDRGEATKEVYRVSHVLGRTLSAFKTKQHSVLSQEERKTSAFFSRADRPLSLYQGSPRDRKQWKSVKDYVVNNHRLGGKGGGGGGTGI
jgi:hypothetical protein